MKKDKYVLLWDSLDGNGFTPYVYKNGKLMENLRFPVKVSLKEACACWIDSINKVLEEHGILDYDEQQSMIGMILNADHDEGCRNIVDYVMNSKQQIIEEGPHRTKFNNKLYYNKVINRQNMIKNLKKRIRWD